MLINVEHPPLPDNNTLVFKMLSGKTTCLLFIFIPDNWAFNKGLVRPYQIVAYHGVCIYNRPSKLPMSLF